MWALPVNATWIFNRDVFYFNIYLKIIFTFLEKKFQICSRK